VTPGNPIVGGTTLRIPAISSPNFVLSPLQGWSIQANGNAYFADLTLSGTFDGTDFVINSSGAFFYSGTPASGNLIASIASAAGTDGFGNSYFPGLCSYTSLGISQMWSGAVNVGVAGQGLGGSNTIAPGQLSNDGGNSGATQLLSGQETSSADVQSAVDLSSANRSTITNGLISLVAGKVSLGASGDALWDDNLGEFLFSAAGQGPFISGEGFHDASGGTGNTVRVKKLPWNAVWLDVQASWAAVGAVNQGTLPDASYYPTQTRQFALASNQGNAQNARVFVPTAGDLQIVVSGGAGNGQGGCSVMYPTN
jgi:hypothetical protein